MSKKGHVIDDGLSLPKIGNYDGRSAVTSLVRDTKTKEVLSVGIDRKPKRGSKNLITSGAVFEALYGHTQEGRIGSGGGRTGDTVNNYTTVTQGASALKDLDDVNLTFPVTHDYLLAFDSSVNQWKARAETYKTATELLTAIKTVDGSGSGLDADYLDNLNGSYYLDYNNFVNTPDLSLKEDKANKGVANGYASLNGTGKVPAAQLPSYVDDIVEGATKADFPATGEASKVYIALDTNKSYRWSGSAYVEVSPSDVNSVNGYTGIITLSTSDIGEGTNLYFTDARAQNAVQSSLDAKVNKAGDTMTGVLNVPVLNVEGYGFTRFNFGTNHDIFLTYGSTGNLYARTYDGTNHSFNYRIWHEGNDSPLAKVSDNENVTGAWTFGSSVRLTSATAALRLNNVSTTNRDALTAAGGDFLFNSTQTKLNYFDSTAWQVVASEAYVDSKVPSTTDDLTEGTSNLYYTDARSRAAISAGGDLTYDSATGVMSYTDPDILTGDAATAGQVVYADGSGGITSESDMQFVDAGLVLNNTLDAEGTSEDWLVINARHPSSSTALGSSGDALSIGMALPSLGTYSSYEQTFRMTHKWSGTNAILDFALGNTTADRAVALTLDNSGNLTATGDVTAYSDRRIKDNIKSINNALNRVLKLKGRFFNRIDTEDSSRVHIGFIAQEIKEIVPEVVSVNESGYHSVNYQVLVALLAEAIKEQQTMIEDLKMNNY